MSSKAYKVDWSKVTTLEDMKVVIECLLDTRIDQHDIHFAKLLPYIREYRYGDE